jgi:uncharacterized protein
MQSFTLLVKPASADCNMKCGYCFYLDKANLYPGRKTHRMSHNTLEKLVSSYMATEQPCYTFGWQGGEPTLMGVDFFQKSVRFQEKYGSSGSMVANGLQTNATLIDRNFACFLAKYSFLLGVSLDGPRHIHDHHRKYRDGRGSFGKVMEGIDQLKKARVEFNILVLVNDYNYNRAVEIYDFFIENDFYYHQYIPCVEYDKDGKLEPYSINGEKWGIFLTGLFRRWYPRDINRVSVRLFDSILQYLVKGRPTICHMEKSCSQYFVVEYNGDVYPCDFFVRKDLLLGNIHTHSWEDIIDSEKYIEFGQAKSGYGYICRSCQFLEVCYGDCLKHRRYLPGDASRLSTLCSGWKMFYSTALPAFKDIASNL